MTPSPEIDRLVYDLYGLTEEEIQIVEGTSIASNSRMSENNSHESETRAASEPSQSGRATQAVAEEAQHPGEGGGGSSQGVAGASGAIHGVRERTGEYGPPQDFPEGEEGGGDPLGSTRYFETAEGRLTYTQVAERLAVSLVSILDEIASTPPNRILRF